MALDRRKKRYRNRLLLAAGAILAVALVATNNGHGATLTAANRCQPTTTSTSITYSCWSAYPEAIYITGFTTSHYRVNWKVACGGKSVKGHSDVHLGVAVFVGKLTQKKAYDVMITHDLCKINVVSTRLSGDGPIGLLIAIDQNHALPAHN